MSATIEEITRLLDEGYTVTISKPNAGVVSVRITDEAKRLVSNGCQRSLGDAMSDAYTETPEIEENERGSRFVSVGPVTLGCISPAARDLLDVVMDAWEEFQKGLSPNHEQTIYGFAYWLIRWSGLVQGKPLEDKG